MQRIAGAEARHQRTAGLLVDTRTVSAPDRVAFWASSTSEVYHPLRVRAESAEQFHAQMWGDWLASVGLFRVAATTNTMSRTRKDIAAGDPECIQLSVLIKGRLECGQRHTAILQPGDMTAYDTSEPTLIHAPEPFDLIALKLPKSVLGTYASELTRLSGRRIPAQSGLSCLALRLFRSAAAGLAEGTIGPDDTHFAECAIDLVRRIRVAVEGAGHAPTRAELLLRAREYIDAHLGDPALDPEQVARACFISTRYLHRVFADEGRTVCGWIRSERLARCRRDLLDPALRAVPIASIAGRWGLPSPSHFSRLFREAHGYSPRELRRNAEQYPAGLAAAAPSHTPTSSRTWDLVGGSSG